MILLWFGPHPDALKKATEIINMKFAEYGFDVNYDRGKTEAVVSFCGPRTVEMRKKFVLCGKPGISIQVAPDRQESACYKHL